MSSTRDTSDVPTKGSLVYTVPLALDDGERERALVALLSDPGADGAVEVVFVSYDVARATPDWMALLPEETGLGSPVCVLIDTATTVSSAVLQERHAGQLSTDALVLIASARAGTAPAARFGSPIITPELDARTEIVADFRQLRAALERAADAAREPADPARAVARVSLQSLGHTLLLADSGPAEGTPVWIPDVQAPYRVGLVLNRVEQAVTLTALAPDPGPEMAVLEISHLGRLLMPLARARDTRRGSARVERFTEGIDERAELDIHITWTTEPEALALASIADLRISALAAKPFARATDAWRRIAAALPDGPDRAILDSTLGEA